MSAATLTPATLLRTGLALSRKAGDGVSGAADDQGHLGDGADVGKSDWDAGNLRPESENGVVGILDAGIANEIANIAADAGKVNDAGIRLEINRRVLKNGYVQLYGVWRERGAGRRFVAYAGTQTVLAANPRTAERLARYRPRNASANFSAGVGRPTASGA